MRRNHFSWGSFFVYGIVGIVVIFLFLRLGVFGHLGNFVSTAVTRPVFSELESVRVSAGEVLLAPFHVATYKRTQDSLEHDVRTLSLENVRLQSLEQENAELRRALNFFERDKYPMITARVIGRLKEAGIDFVVLNRGSRDGVLPGYPIAVDGVLLGKVVKATSSISVVAPLWATGSTTASAFAGSTATQGLVQGELNASLVMKLIPKDVEVHEGTKVITSGLEDKVPQGLLIGTVEKVETEPQELFQTAFLKPTTSLYDVSIVSIIQLHESS